MYTAALLGQRKVHWENPTCVYYLGAALNGHLWEVSGTEDMGVGWGWGYTGVTQKAMNPDPAVKGAAYLKSTWQRTEVATPTKGTWCQHLKQTRPK